MAGFDPRKPETLEERMRRKMAYVQPQQEALIKAPTLNGFHNIEKTVCPACGMGPVGPFLKFIRKLFTGQLMIPCKATFCAGGKAPTEEVQLPKFAQEAMGFTPEISHRCAGIFTPHLHLTCCCCGFQWLTEAK